MHKKVCIKYVHLTSFKIIEEIKKNFKYLNEQY